jgi:hypothetical protein
MILNVYKNVLERFYVNIFDIVAYTRIYGIFRY